MIGLLCFFIICSFYTCKGELVERRTREVASAIHEPLNGRYDNDDSEGHHSVVHVLRSDGLQRREEEEDGDDYRISDAVL